MLRLLSILLGLISLTAPAGEAVALAAPARSVGQELLSGDEVEGRYGVYEGTFEGLVSVRTAAFNEQGELYLAGDHRVQVYVPDADGLLQPAGGFGRRGNAAGELQRPGGLAVAPGGLIYVADTGNHRVQMFQADGRWQGRFGSRGPGPEQLVEPVGLAVSDEWVYVADSGNNRVQVFDRLGRPVQSWHADGLLRPTGLARDAAGRVFVADSGNNRIVVLDSEGGVLASVGERGPFPGLFVDPRGLAVSDGRLYVADTENHRIQVFDVEGILRGESAPLYEWGKHALEPREGAGRLHYPDALAVAPGGGRVVVCESFMDRVQVFGPALDGVAAYAADPTVRTGLAAHYGPSISVRERLLLLMEPESQTLQAMDVTGQTPIMVTRLGGWGDAYGQSRRLSGLGFGPAGRVFVSDGDLGRIQTWRLDHDPEEAVVFRAGAGHLVHSVDLAALLEESDRPIRPGALALDDDGLLYVVDDYAAEVLVFDRTWNLVRRFGAGRLQRPMDIAVIPPFSLEWDEYSSSEAPHETVGPARIAVADGDLGRVLVFGLEGELDAILGAGVLDEPGGVAGDSGGRVLVTDRATHKVHLFDILGLELLSWGGPGLGAGEFYKPRGITEMPHGELLVLDHGNHRGQMFQADGSFVTAFGRRLYVDAAQQPEATEPLIESNESNGEEP